LLSPLCRIFTIIYLKQQTILLGYNSVAAVRLLQFLVLVYNVMLLPMSNVLHVYILLLLLVVVVLVVVVVVVIVVVWTR
jgi:hypothetical protein